MIKILTAQLEDMETILQLQYAAYQSEALIHNDFSIQPLRQTLAESIAEYHQSIILKAVQGDEIIGSVRARTAGDTAYIGKLMVHPKHQGNGLGKRLLAAIESQFPNKRYELFTSCKSDRNLHLYENAGYTRFREETDHAGIRFVYLEKDMRANVNIREWKISDAPDLASAINNPKVLDNLRDGVPYPYTEKDAEEFINAMLTAEKDTQYAFAITYNDKAIGSIGIFRKDNVHRLTAELGYYIAEPYWGKGFMTEAVRQICAYTFNNTDIIRIFAEPYAFNNASCRVLEKAGFQLEGVLCKNAIKNNQIIDMKMYALIKESL